MAPPSSREPQRIAKLLARAGVASRREVERMIAEGRIALDGTPLDTPATLLESLHGVTVDGNPVAAPAPARLFRYHKPAGLLTTERDPGGRPTIYDRLPHGLPRLVPVGRLDLNTEGCCCSPQTARSSVSSNCRRAASNAAIVRAPMARSARRSSRI